jgi:hypothetical protein
MPAGNDRQVPAVQADREAVPTGHHGQVPAVQADRQALPARHDRKSAAVPASGDPPLPARDCWALPELPSEDPTADHQEARRSLPAAAAPAAPLAGRLRGHKTRGKAAARPLIQDTRGRARARPLYLRSPRRSELLGDSRDAGADSTWVPVRPAPGFHLRNEIRHALVEGCRLLEIDRVTGIRHNQQSR